MDARLLLATRQVLLLPGLQQLLRRENGIRSVVAARTKSEVLETLDREPVDVAVLDVDTSGLRVAEIAGHMRRPHKRVRWIALTEKRARPELERIMHSGPAGIVSMDGSARSLGEAVRRVHVGHSYVSNDIASLLISASLSLLTDRKDALSLSHRECEVLRLIAQDCSSREIAIRLDISRRTVETHRARLMGKLGFRKTAQLVRFAVREGLVRA